ncbi:hypothetical protein ACJX0J_012116, partial [Zea mays]
RTILQIDASQFNFTSSLFVLMVHNFTTILASPVRGKRAIDQLSLTHVFNYDFHSLYDVCNLMIHPDNFCLKVQYGHCQGLEPEHVNPIFFGRDIYSEKHFVFDKVLSYAVSFYTFFFLISFVFLWLIPWQAKVELDNKKKLFLCLKITTIDFHGFSRYNYQKFFKNIIRGAII